MRIAWFSDLDLLGSGYKNVSVPICSGLVARGHELLAIGIGYKGDQHDFPFGVIPVRSIREAEATLMNLQNMWNCDATIVALDIPWQERLIDSNLMRNRKMRYVGVFPVEADPLCISWAMVLMQMDKQLVISQFGTDEARKVGVPAEYVPIGMDMEAWPMPTPEQKLKLRGAFGFKDDTFVVLTIADNQERKNLSAGMEAFAKFAQGKDNVHYVIVTREHNPVGWKLRDLGQEFGINDKLMIFERGMPHKDLWTTYAISNAFLLPSKTEGLGMPLLEAMACGIPCVATNCTGMKELLSDGRGILVDHEYSHRDPFGNGNRYWINKTEVANVLECLYLKQDTSEMVRKAREFVEKRDWKVAIDVTEKALLEATGK